jgi:hypothetical protein
MKKSQKKDLLIIKNVVDAYKAAFRMNSLPLK